MPGPGRSRQAIERLFQGDVTVEVVAPVAAHSLQPLTLDRPLDAPDVSEPEFRLRGQRCGKIYAAGQMQRGQLSCIFDLGCLLRPE